MSALVSAMVCLGQIPVGWSQLDAPRRSIVATISGNPYVHRDFGSVRSAFLFKVIDAVQNIDLRPSPWVACCRLILTVFEKPQFIWTPNQSQRGLTVRKIGDVP